MDIQKNGILTGTQQFRYEILQWCGNMEDAQKAYAFIMGDENLGKQAQLPKSTMNDGIYLVQADGKATLFAWDETQLPSESEVVAIGLKMGDFSIEIALHDEAKGEEITLTTAANGTDKQKDEVYYISNYDDAVADIDGESNTDHLRNILNPKIKLETEWYIPSLGELLRIFINKKAINEALDYIGGDRLQDKWYWTSTESSATIAWGLGLDDGNAYSWSPKASDAGRVRAVSAFII